MAENKKRKKPKKRNNPYPPLSKKDKRLYVIFKLSAVLFLSLTTVGFLILPNIIVLNNSDLLAVTERWTLFLILPFIFTFGGVVLFDSERNKMPLYGNKDIDYYNTANHRFVLPIFDERYKNIESCQKAKSKFFKKIMLWSVIFAGLLSIGFLGCLGRQEFSKSNITTYSIFNTAIESQSYKDAQSYDISTEKFRYAKPQTVIGSSQYDVILTVNFKNGKSFSADYGSFRNIYAMKELDALLAGKPKSIDDSYLSEFISTHTLTEDELKVLYELFEK